MADEKDDQKHPHLLLDPETLPGKKRGRSMESSSSDSSNHEEEDPVEVKKQKLQELQRKAFCSLIYSFKRENFKLSFRRNQIIQELMREWNISQEAYYYVEAKVEEDLKEMQKEKEATEFDGSWGRVDPKSLTGRTADIKLPGEDHFQEFLIGEYCPKQDMHRLVYTNPYAEWADDYSSWIDLRQLTRYQEIVWKHGEAPNFEAA